MTTLHYEFESDDAATPRNSNLDEDQVVAGLYQDVHIDIDDRFSAPTNSKPTSVPAKSSGLRNFNFSIPIHTQKLNEKKAFSAQLFNISKPGVEPATAVESVSTKMESPTFCKGDSELISPSFPTPLFDDLPRDNKLSIKPGLLSDSDIKSPASQESVVKQVSANKQEQKPRLSGTLQEAFSRKSQNSHGSSKTNMINPAPEYGISKPTLNLYAQKSDRGGSNKSAGLDKKDSNHGKVPNFFFGEKGNGLNNELQRPESSPDVDKSRNTSSAIQTSRTVGVEVSYNEHADPLSLGNFDQKFRSKPVSSQVSSRRTQRETPKSPINEGAGLGLVNSKSNSNLKTVKTMKKEEKLSQGGDNRSSLYKKIMAQGKTPKEIDVQQAAPADFRPKVEKVAKPVTPTRNPGRVTPKMVGAENVVKQTSVSNTDHSLKAWKVQGGESSPKRNTSTTEGNPGKNHHKSPSQSNSPKRNGVGGNGFFKEMTRYHTLQVSSPKAESPKMKSSNSQKTFNSITPNGTVLDSPEKRPKQQQENNRNASNVATNKATELKRTRAYTTQTTMNKSVGNTTPKNMRQPSKSPKVVQHKLYQFDEAKAKGEMSPGKLQVIEANLREIQGKNLMHPGHPGSPKRDANSPKHVRYPSFGSLENQRRPSSRRTISQDSQSGIAAQQFANSIEKERARLTPTPKSGNKPYIPLGKIEEVKENHQPVQLIQPTLSAQSTPTPKPLHDVKLSHSSLMKSLNLRKTITSSSQQEDGSTPASSRSHRAVLVNNPSDVNINDLMPHTVHGSSQPNSGLLNKGGIVDIYQRNSQWLSSKQAKIQQSEVSKKKEEMKECTFKPHRNIMINPESEYSQKNFNNYGIGRVSSETNQGLERRSLSKEKRTLNSYGGLHHFRKEVMTPKPSSGKSPKSGGFFQKKETVDSAFHYTNPH